MKANHCRGRAPARTVTTGRDAQGRVLYKNGLNFKEKMLLIEKKLDALIRIYVV